MLWISIELDRSRIRAGLAAVAVTVLVSGCMHDPMGMSARPGGADGQTRSETLFRVATGTAAAGDYSSAITLFRRAIEVEPANADARLGLGRVLLVVGAYDEAVEAFRTVFEWRQNDPEALRGLGQAFLALDQPRAAITQFEGSLEVAEDVRSYNGIGVCHDMLGDHRAAQAFYRSALNIERGNLSTRNNLALSLAVSGAFEEATAILKEVVADPRATPRHRLNLALVYGLSGDMQRATEIARIDLDERSVRNNITYYHTLRALKDSRATFRAIGSHSDSFPVANAKPDGARAPKR